MALDIMSVKEWKQLSGHWSQMRELGHHSLRAIDAALEQYHQKPKENIEERIRALNQILVVTEKYVANKSTTSKLKWRDTRRKTKVSAAEVLHDQADAKRDYLASVLGIERNLPAMFGVGRKTPMQAAETARDRWRALTDQVTGLRRYIGNPSDGRLLHSDYWTEAIDPLHRNWGHPTNSPIFKEWVKQRHDTNQTPLSFYRWFEKLSDAELDRLVPVQLLQTAYQDAKGREEYRVYVLRGKLRYLATPDRMETFDTGPYRTNFAGQGWCIFVISREGDLYCGNHDDSQGWFHAAFLGGKPVTAAGELHVKNGVLHAVTPKSGHYKPRPMEIVNGLKVMKDKGLDLSRAQAMAFYIDPRTQKGVVAKGGGTLCEWYDAETYVSSGGARGLLRTEGIQKSYRLVWNPGTGKPQLINGDEWLDKNKFKGWFHPEHPAAAG